MAKLSFAEIKRRLQGQDVVRRVTGRPTVENIPAIRQALADELARLNAEHGTDHQLGENDQTFYLVGGGRTWMKPKLPAVSVGKIGFRSKDYCFTPDGAPEGCWGETNVSAMELRETGFTRTYENGIHISYDLS